MEWSRYIFNKFKHSLQRSLAKIFIFYKTRMDCFYAIFWIDISSSVEKEIKSIPEAESNMYSSVIGEQILYYHSSLTT